MTKQDYERLQQNLNLPPHTPLKTQIDLLKDDVLKLVSEVMRLKNHLAAVNEAQVALINELQTAASESYSAGASQMRQSVLEACCPDCTKAVIQLSNQRIPQ